MDGHPPPAPATSAAVVHISISPGSSSLNPWSTTWIHSLSTVPWPCPRAPSFSSGSVHPSSVFLSLLNHLVQFCQFQSPKRRCYTLALWNNPLCSHPNARCDRLVQGIRTLGRPLHSSENKIVTQFSKIVPTRLVPRVKCTCRIGGRNRV
ncbi:hypothetical protein, unlikely [Trypanosoma congolense IL3000]|uniref:Uncharacterized protein n=1 Tax=Trypanosoma congolense (strain IL3000) TaxID=1068625 RepID=F9WE70_TRYCI|nr:hypothetical protein, unlikely [Trypanosoma congolense IL3000]